MARLRAFSSSTWEDKGSCLWSLKRVIQVLGIPWDIDTDGLREYMSKYVELEDCIVMKERSTGRSHGFGYVKFAFAEDAKLIEVCHQVRTFLVIECWKLKWLPQRKR